MPEKSSHSTDPKRRHRRTREHARSPFDEDDFRSEKKRSRRHADTDDAQDSGGKFGPNMYSLQVSDPIPQSGSDISLSVKETNALRAKLGLAPLETEETQPSEDRIVDNQSENYVHAPAKDLKKARETDAIKDRLSIHKEKRALYDKYANSRLYEPEEKDISVVSWLDKLREKERIKKQAQERAKVLTEMDEQFEVPQTDVSSHRGQPNVVYRSDDLSGLKVEHKVDRFVEGKSIILTLKDKGMLLSA
ncbi:unnamed protein product [Echinostoma caproni]|uniref:Hepatocellular carcinoma-associated antigen 59-domain-containing protein n=1 Tax=Echinostoma caproni TaxID=27848 RepID=A0A183BEF6_9TREM|nr:unnamed protein product [Echinostoma caproni]